MLLCGEKGGRKRLLQGSMGKGLFVPPQRRAPLGEPVCRWHRNPSRAFKERARDDRTCPTRAV